MALLIATLSSFGLSARAAPELKDHILFVGTDLAVGEDGAFYPVVGATKDSLKIDKNHGMEEVRTGKGANIRINRGVKLSSLSAMISDVKMESVDRAAARAQLAAMQAMMVLQQETEDQEDRLHGKMTLLSAVAANSNARAADGTPIRGSDTTAKGIKDMQDAALADYTNALPKLDALTASTTTLLSDTIAHFDLVDDEVTLDASALPGLRLLGGSDMGGSANGGSGSGGSGVGSSAISSLVQHNTPSSTTVVEPKHNISGH